MLESTDAGHRELAELLDRAGERPDRLSAAEVRELGTRYREAAADVALLRVRRPGAVETRRLEQLVVRGRQAVYGDVGPGRAPLAFVRHGYWRAVRDLAPQLALASLLFFGSMALAMLWGATDPDAARGVVPGGFIDAAQPPSGSQELSAGESAAFSSEVLTNNIQVTFLVFAAGLLLGVGGALLLLYNGLVIGALLGVAQDAGTLGAVLDAIVSHGVLELSCIVVAGAAGLRFGWSVIDAGPGTRREQVIAAARPAFSVVLGTAPWLVVAGVAEGFVSPSGLSGTGVVAVGVALGAVYWALVVVLGRTPRSVPAA